MADEAPDDVMHSACDPELPDTGEVWGVVGSGWGCYVGRAQLESLVEPDGIADDSGRESVAFICVHEPILPTLPTLFVSTVYRYSSTDSSNFSRFIWQYLLLL